MNSRIARMGLYAMLVTGLLATLGASAAAQPVTHFCFVERTGVMYVIDPSGTLAGNLPTDCIKPDKHFVLAAVDIQGDHGKLLGLDDPEDHAYALLIDGSRALTGNLLAGGNKLTGLAAASGAGDAVPYEQAVKNGDEASGDLGGTYPDPSVVKIQGQPISDVDPTTGNVLTWTGSEWIGQVPLAENIDYSQFQQRVFSFCDPERAIRQVNEDGSVVCELDDDTKYSAGFGLNLAAEEFSVDPEEYQRRVVGYCPLGESIRAINSDGTVVCEATDGTFDNLVVNGDGSIGGNLDILQGSINILQGSINAADAGNFGGDLDVVGNGGIQGGLNVQGDAALGGNLIAAGGADIGGSLTVRGALNVVGGVQGDLHVAGSGTFVGDLAVDGALDVGGWVKTSDGIEFGDGSTLTSAPTGGGVSVHSDLAGLEADDHTQYLLADGVRNTTNGFAVTGTRGSGSIPATGTGTRLMWYPNKSAFRVGMVQGNAWDDSNVGTFSIAAGFNTTASGEGSTAMGGVTNATGNYSTAMGYHATRPTPPR